MASLTTDKAEDEVKELNEKDVREQVEDAKLKDVLQLLGADTGDIVLFDRACSSMSPYGASICVAAKMFGRTRFDHNGIVIRDPESGELFLLEAALSGVKLRPLSERIRRSRAHEVTLRKLQAVRDDEFCEKAWEFAHWALDSPYENRPQRLFNAGVNVPTRQGREKLFHSLIAAKKELVRLDGDLQHRRNMPQFERNALETERERVGEKYRALTEQLRQTERSIFENEMDPLFPKDRDGQVMPSGASSKVFCSQLAAALYQYLGLLLPYPSSNSYLPKHFSDKEGDGTGVNDYLKFQQDVSFLSEISLRKHLTSMEHRFRQLEEEKTSRQPQEGKELSQLVACLRRHQLFHMLSEPELISIAKQFRRRELLAGETLFYQGEAGEFFYIVEEGECDVYVDYDHYLHESTMDDDYHHTKSNEEKTETHQSASKLSRSRSTRLTRRSTLGAMGVYGSNLGQQSVLVATNGPESALGESALMYDTPRRATVRSKQGAVLWRLDKPTFRQIVSTHPDSQKSLDDQRFLLEAISDHPLFAELGERAKAMAVRKCFPLDVRAGSTVLRQGDQGDYFYLIQSGRCQITRHKPNRTEEFVDRVIGSGSTFGEAALLYNSRRGATVTALEDAKVWCMDRASFLTITRSGSAALFNLFRKMSRESRSETEESFITRDDLEKMLSRPRRVQASIGDNDVEKVDLPSPVAYDRGMALAFSLLFHDASGLVNFSQFAHFHIALGAPSTDQLLPEASFRMLKSEKLGTPGCHDDDEHQGAIRLQHLPSTVRKWLRARKEELPARSEKDELEYLRTLFGFSNEVSDKRYVTHDDLSRAITALEDEEKKYTRHGAVYTNDSDFRRFVEALKDDIEALRGIWRAAELHADGLAADVNQGKVALTFDSNLKSGWMSAIRHNPAANDWDYPKGVLTSGKSTTESTSVSESVQKLQDHVAAFISAIAAGTLARTACAPLERLKILMQVSTPSSTRSSTKLLQVPYPSTFRGLKNMVRVSGARSLYSGNFAHCLWVVPSLPTKFMLCDIYRNKLQTAAKRSKAGGEFPFLTSLERHSTNLLAGGLAGLTVNGLFYPLEAVRGRLSVQQYISSDRYYSGIQDCFRKMHSEEGMKAFYRGFVPSSLGVFTYIGCNYAIYEFLRPVFVLYDTDKIGSELGHPSVPGQILCATISSMTSQFVSYPFDVVRRRMQVQGAWHPDLSFPSYKSLWSCVKDTVREEPKQRVWGWKVPGLYRGLVPNCVKSVPSAVISFLTYETIRGMAPTTRD